MLALGEVVMNGPRLDLESVEDVVDADIDLDGAMALACDGPTVGYEGGRN